MMSLFFQKLVKIFGIWRPISYKNMIAMQNLQTIGKWKRRLTMLLSYISIMFTSQSFAIRISISFIVLQCLEFTAAP